MTSEVTQHVEDAIESFRQARDAETDAENIDILQDHIKAMNRYVSALRSIDDVRDENGDIPAGALGTVSVTTDQADESDVDVTD